MPFLSFMDMIDGGGMGKAGDKFEGGGLLSELGNALFKPRGYYDRHRQVTQSTMSAPVQRPAQTQPAQSAPITMDELKAIFARSPSPITQGPIPPQIGRTGAVQNPEEWGKPGSTVDPLTFLRALGYPI